MMKKPQEGKINFLGRTKILIQNRILYPRKLFKKKQLRVKNILKIGNKNEGIAGEKKIHEKHCNAWPPMVGG